METLSGILSPASVSLSGTLAKEKGEPYEGEYEVTPSAEEQTLLTGGKLLENDIVVNPVGLPFADVSGVTAVTSVVRSGYKFVNKNGELLNGTYNPPAASWSRGAFPSGDAYQWIVQSEVSTSTRAQVYVSKNAISGKIIFVRIQAMMSGSMINHFIASDTIFFGYFATTSNILTPTAIIASRYNGTTKTIQTYSNVSSAYGVYASSFEAGTSSSYLTIASRPSGGGNVAGVYAIAIYSLSLPSGIVLLPNLG